MMPKLDGTEFKSTTTEPDMWHWPDVKTNGKYYYDYILIYANGLLSINKYQKVIMD